MLVRHSTGRRPGRIDPRVAEALAGVSQESLRATVEMLAFPRHYVAERAANVRARDLLVERLRSFGYAPTLQGEYDNIVASTGDGPAPLLGAHYDSVPGTQGADDNGSAVAVCLECARLLKQHAGRASIVFFNREEDGLLGSTEFVADLRKRRQVVTEAHVFEMVGYRSREPGSQRTPGGLPGFLAPSVGDFIGLLSNGGSNAIAEALLTLAATHAPATPAVALEMYLGVEAFFGDLARSDHVPFWKAGIPAVMWTDTADFRNPHYHRASDTPDTLDYAFMADVAKVALARALART